MICRCESFFKTARIFIKMQKLRLKYNSLLAITCKMNEWYNLYMNYLFSIFFMDKIWTINDRNCHAYISFPKDIVHYKKKLSKGIPNNKLKYLMRNKCSHFLKLPLGPLWYSFEPRCTIKILWSWHFLQVFYSTTDNFLWWWVHISLYFFFLHLKFKVTQ